jgi:hypothetical protein
MFSDEIADLRESTLISPTALKTEHLKATNAANDWHGGPGSQSVTSGI